MTKSNAHRSHVRRRDAAIPHGPRLVAAALGLAAIGIAARAGPPEGGGAAAPREVTLRTADGLAISGTFRPGGGAGGPGAVLLPKYRSDRTAWEPVLEAFRVRGVGVLAIDPRGHGRSAKQGKVDLGAQVESRDPKLFAAMHEDAIAAVRWLVKEGGCDAKRIALVGASVGGSVALDTANRHPTEVAAVAWMSPGVRYLGLDTLAHLKGLPAAVPLLLLSHRGEIDVGARKIADARPGARLVVYDDPPPPEAGAERAWAHGTRMFGRLPLVEQAVASFVAAATGSKTEDVVLDGVVAREGADADPWDRAVDVAPPGTDGTIRAFRVGRRILFGGTAAPGISGLRFEVQTGAKTVETHGISTLGPPQIVGADLRTSAVTWSWGGMGSMPTFPGMDTSQLFGKTYPVLRAVSSEAGTTFEGEWFIPEFGGKSDLVRLLISLAGEPPPRPEGGGVMSDVEHSVDLPSR